jgi:hypothetical protein
MGFFIDGSKTTWLREAGRGAGRERGDARSFYVRVHEVSIKSYRRYDIR